jgi:hypothetical protein
MLSGTSGWHATRAKAHWPDQQDALTTLARVTNLGAALDWMIRSDQAKVRLRSRQPALGYRLVRGTEEGRGLLARVLEMSASRAPDPDRLLR